MKTRMQRDEIVQSAGDASAELEPEGCASDEQVEESILVVDDQKSVRSILTAYLEADGYNCKAASSAEEALGLLDRSSFELVISDILMPGMSGLELLQELQPRRPDTAVIMLTARGGRDIAVRALKMGAYGYITKPFKRDEILISVFNALERRRLKIEAKNYARELEERVRNQTRDLRHSHEEICLRLIQASQFHHDETAAHVRRIGSYAQLVARHMELPDEQTDVIRLVAATHDIGKIGVPDTILNKPERLTRKEWEVMKTHTTMGGRILGHSSIPVLRLGQEVAVYHHERWDGRGYPDGLCGEECPLVARIVKVLDVYDALVHDRVYRPAVPEDHALGMIAAGRETRFCPSVCDAFFEKLPEIQQIRASIQCGSNAGLDSDSLDRVDDIRAE